MISFTDEYHARLTGPWTDIQDQLPLLFERACRYPDGRVAEFGVRTGESTTAFLAAAAKVGCQVWSVDINPPDVPLAWHQDPHWHFAQCDSASAQAQAFIPQRLDLLFIDTSHAYEQTMAELRAYVPRVRSGGLVLMHDTKLANPPFEPFAVARALDDYCAETGRAWGELGGMFGLGEILL